MKILIIRLSAIGDVIHCLPAAAILKRALPEAEICWLVEPFSAQLLTNNPGIDRVLVFPAKVWLKEAKGLGKAMQSIRAAKKFFAELRAEKFDIAIDMQGLLKSGLLALASGAPLRVGFAGTREFAESFLTHRLDVGDYFGHFVPVVDLNNRLAEYALHVLGARSVDGAVTFPLPPPTLEMVTKVQGLTSDLVPRAGSSPAQAQPPAAGASPPAGLVPQAESIPVVETAPAAGATPEAAPAAETGSSPQSLADQGSEPNASGPGISFVPNIRNVVFIPGTTWSTKIWPEEKWVALGSRILQDIKCRILVVGGRLESESNKRIVSQLTIQNPGASVLDLTEKTSLLELVALFERCEVVIGPDTGPVHLAAAVASTADTPKVLGIYGATPWRRLGPYGPRCRSVSLSLDCQPCYEKVCPLGTIACLKDLQVETVYAALFDLLKGVPQER